MVSTAIVEYFIKVVKHNYVGLEAVVTVQSLDELFCSIRKSLESRKSKLHLSGLWTSFLLLNYGPNLLRSLQTL